MSIIFFCNTSGAQILISLLLGDNLNTGKIEFGLDGGLNLTNINGLDEGDISSRFNIGFYFDIKTKNPNWLFHTGVIVKSTMGAEGIPVYPLNNKNLDSVFAGGSVERRLGYFNVPLMMKYKFNKYIFAEAGTMLALRSKSVDVFTQSIVDNDDLKYELKIRDELHPIDAGVIAGIGYRLLGGNGMNIGIRYYLGLVDITIDDSTPNQYNSSLYFTVGIPIGAGKAAKKQEEKN